LLILALLAGAVLAMAADHAGFPTGKWLLDKAGSNPEPTPYFRSDDDAFKKTLQRLFGFDGQLPRKLIAAQSDHANETADECDVDDDG
jgi:hypothetical protein